MADRYRFACEMAEVWFKIISSMNEEHRKQIKKELAGHTLVGEYVGSQDH